MSISITYDGESASFGIPIPIFVQQGLAYFSDQQLIIENLTECKSLWIMECYDLKISNLSKLTSFNIYNNNPGARLEIENCPKINKLDLGVEFIDIKSELNELSILSLFNGQVQIKGLDFGKLAKLTYFIFQNYQNSFFKLNLHKITNCNCTNFDKKRNYKNRIRKARKIIIKLIIKNRIKYFWNRYLESTKDGISRFCYLSNK